MVPRAEYLRFALVIQEAADESPEKLKAALEAAIAKATGVDPWKTHLQEAGARHSASDMGHLQAIHDASAVLGASCAGGMAESAKDGGSGLRLQESATETEPIRLSEAKADYEIKLIAAGRGSMAVYPEDVLKRDGPGAFPANTKIYFNHPTKMEAGEPIGNRDVKRFAGVTVGPAMWKENHARGAGLYAPSKFFSDHAQQVEEKGAHLGMSVILNGHQKMEAGRKVFDDGLPVLAKITSGESVDVVPIAGAGGLIVQESAASAATHTQESEMDDATKAELKALREAQVTQAADNKKLLERAMRGDARELAASILQPLALREAGKRMVVENLIGVEGDYRALPLKDNSLDAAKFTEAVNKEASRLAAVLSDGAVVRGMGVGSPLPQAEDPAAITAREAAAERTAKNRVNIYKDIMGGNIKAAEAAVGYKGAA